MSDNEHTPGPWSIQLFEGEDVGWIDGQDPCHYLLNKEGERFALVSTPTNPETLVSYADARLIAAAPELLAALKRTLSMAIGHAADARGVSPAECRDFPWARDAQAAIDNATEGEER